MSEIVAGIIWFAFAGYAFWYMFKAREYQPLTLARALIKILFPRRKIDRSTQLWAINPRTCAR